MDGHSVHTQTVLAEDGPEHLPDGTVGLGLDTDTFAWGQVQAEQDPALDDNLLAAQGGDVLTQVQRLLKGEGRRLRHETKKKKMIEK